MAFRENVCCFTEPSEQRRAVSDRLADLSGGSIRRIAFRVSARHAQIGAADDFCVQHHVLWICAIGLIALVDAGVIATRLEFRVLAAGVVIGTVALVYLVLNHRWSQLSRVLPIKLKWRLAVSSPRERSLRSCRRFLLPYTFPSYGHSRSSPACAR